MVIEHQPFSNHFIFKNHKKTKVEPFSSPIDYSSQFRCWSETKKLFLNSYNKVVIQLMQLETIQNSFLVHLTIYHFLLYLCHNDTKKYSTRRLIIRNG